MSLPFTPDPNDGAVQLLRSVFGSVMDGLVAGNTDTATSAASSMLGEAFRFFNSGVLLFGSVLLMFVTIAGISNTANDGEALGKRWSTFYTPLRMLVSTSSLIPTASGYAGVQVAILMVVCWSIGFASHLWSAVVNYSVGQEITQQAVQSITDDPHFEELAVDALRMQVCAAGINKAVNSTVASTPVNLTLKMDDPQPVSSNSYTSSVLNSTTSAQQALSYTTKFYYQDPAWPGSESICGQIILSATFDKPNSNSNTTQSVAQSLRESIANIHRGYVKALFASTSPVAQIAQQIVQASDGGANVIDTDATSATIAQIKQQLMSQVTNEVTTQVQNENADIAKSLSERGWIYAGSLYVELGRLKDAIRTATTPSSEYLPGTNSLDNFLTGDVAKAADGILNRYNVVASEVAKKTLAKQAQQSSTHPKMPVVQTSFSKSDFVDGGGAARSAITGWISHLSMSALSGVVYYMGAPNEDPVLKVKNVGDWLATFAESAMVTKATISASLKGLEVAGRSLSAQPLIGALPAVWAGIVAGIGSFLTQLWAALMPSVSALLYLGYFLGIWVPMIPYYIFAMGVAGWLVFVGEMLAAGMLWMAAHTTPSRDGSFMGSQSQGYLLILSGFFRPALMIVGLVLSIALLGPLINFINPTFMAAVSAVQADSTTGLLSLAGYMLGYALLIFSLFMLVFGLPQSFPDRILRWIGGGIGDMGEQSSVQRLEGSASNQARTAAIAGAAKAASLGSKDRNAADNLRNKEKLALQDKASEPEGVTGQSTILAESEPASSTYNGSDPEVVEPASSAYSNNDPEIA